MDEKNESDSDESNVMKCHTCNRVIENCRYAKCLICGNLVQCLECLSIGKEIDCHTFDHPFAIIEQDSYPIFCEDWDAEEEVQLLNLIKRLGFGNWEDISEMMDCRTAVECEKHYFDVYLYSQNTPLPENRIHKPFPPPTPPPFDTTPKESNPTEGTNVDLINKNKKRKTTLAEFNGYMPYRHEFEEFFHKEAEKLICNLAFDQKKENHDSFYMKIQNLICYNSQVAERQLRTQTVEDFDIAHIDLTNKTEQDLAILPLQGSHNADIYADGKILPLGQYIGADQTIQFAQYIHRRTELDRNIELRQFCISQGIDDLKDVILLSKLKKNVKKGKIINIKGWNEEISKISDPVSANYAFKMLSKIEKNFCIDNDMDVQLFMAIKSLILREYAIRGRLSKEDLLKMCSSEPIQKQICLAYDMFKSVGWIS